MNDFLNHLRQEKLNTQKSRFEFIRLKFILVVGLFGIGNWKFTEFSENYLLLYLVPFVGFAIDLYIHGENFAIRRIGYFVREIEKCIPVERAWELYVDKNRDRYTRAGIYVVSILLFISTFLILQLKEDNNFRENYGLWHYLWVFVNLVILSLFILCSYRGYNSLKKNKKPIKIKKK